MPSFHPTRKRHQQRARNWIRSAAICFGLCAGGGSEATLTLFCEGAAKLAAKRPSTTDPDTSDFDPPVALSTLSSTPEPIVGRVQGWWAGMGTKRPPREYLYQSYSHSETDKKYVHRDVPGPGPAIKTIQFNSPRYY